MAEVALYGQTAANEPFFMHIWGASSDGHTAYDRVRLWAGPNYQELEDGFLVVKSTIDPSGSIFSWEGFLLEA